MIGSSDAVVWLGLAALLGATPGCDTETIAEQAEGYFNLRDAAEFAYATEAGASEVHEYTRQGAADDETKVFDRLVTRFGFIEPDTTVRFEATNEQTLQITRFNECILDCVEPRDPIVVFDSWPLEGGEESTTETTADLTDNGEAAGEREERHRFAVANPAPVTVPAGTFEEAFQVIWTRTIDGTSESSAFTFVAEVGFVVVESFDSVRFELESGPIDPPDEDDGAG